MSSSVSAGSATPSAAYANNGPQSATAKHQPSAELGKAVATGSDAAINTAEGIRRRTNQAASQVADGFVAGKDKTKETVQKVSNEARGYFSNLRHAYDRGTLANAGERAITNLGYYSMPLAKAGAVLFTGAAVLALTVFTTTWVPVSWILVGAAVVSLIDVLTSIKHRSGVKAQDPAAHPLTAYDDSDAKALQSTNAPSEGTAGAANADAEKTVTDEADAVKENVADKADAAGKTVAEKAESAGKTVAEKAESAGKTVAEKAESAGKTVAQNAESTGQTVAEEVNSAVEKKDQ